MEHYIDLAGLILRVQGPEEDFSAENTVLSDYFVEPQRWDYEMTCNMTEKMPEERGTLIASDYDRRVYWDGNNIVSHIGYSKASSRKNDICIVRGEKSSQVYFSRINGRNAIQNRSLCSAMEAEHIIAQNHGILLHSSYIQHEDAAILFTAPSGIGKSTQAELWKKYRGAEIINGDRSAVRTTEIGAVAYGIPFCGSSNIRKRVHLPLRSIVYLAQASETRIERLSGRRAFRMIWEGCSIHTWNRDDVEKSMDTVTQIINRVPIFYLACKPDESAVIALEHAMK